jgi:hypothetical protein
MNRDCWIPGEALGDPVRESFDRLEDLDLAAVTSIDGGCPIAFVSTHVPRERAFDEVVVDSVRSVAARFDPRLHAFVPV